ncbi:MAG: UbiA family prenyltransferase, partial [Bacteroidales bacterium]|nr:UbiA family prenyltransferase [Bacteroidales bacterium]
MNSKTTYYPAYSFRFYRALWIHMRPYLLYISGIAGLTGMAIAPNNFVSMSTLILAFVPFFLGYGFGQALTDCFQIDTDSISAPYRPLVKKEVSPKSLGIASTLGLILISAIIVWLNPYNFLFCILTIIGLASYTYFKKRFWFTGPFYNAWIVMLLPIIGYMAVLGGSYNSLVNKDLMLVCALSFAAYANFVLIGYLKDINADRKTGYKTFPVVFGWNKTVWFGDVNVLLSVIFCYLLVDFTKVFAIILFVV